MLENRTQIMMGFRCFKVRIIVEIEVRVWEVVSREVIDSMPDKNYGQLGSGIIQFFEALKDKHWITR